MFFLSHWQQHATSVFWVWQHFKMILFNDSKRPNSYLRQSIRSDVEQDSQKPRVPGVNTDETLLKSIASTIFPSSEASSFSKSSLSTFRDLLCCKGSNDYQGPIVEGWPPSKSRNVSDYVRGEFLFVPKIPVKSQLEILVVVQSALFNFGLRQSIRKTFPR